jgi:hypothetical protein
MKRTIFFTLFLIGFLGAKAQDYYQSAGGGVINALHSYSFQEKSSGLFDEGSDMGSVPGIYYKATFGFEASRNTNFAISAMPFLGLYLSSQYGGFIGFDLPVYGEFYIGDIDDQHFYLQGGFSYSFVGADYFAGSIIGPRVGLGGQIDINRNLYSVHLSLAYGLNKSDVNSGWNTINDNRYLLNISFGYMFNY